MLIKYQVAAIVLCVASVGGSCLAKEPPNGRPLPGLVSAPRKLPAIGRWQLARKIPRGLTVALAWNADGTEIAYSDETYVRICDAKTLETKKFLAGHSGRVTAIDWNHRTHRIASSSYDGTVRVWSAAGLPEKMFEPNAGELKSVAWTNDGTRLAAASSRGSVCLWGADERLVSLQISQVSINCVAWSPDGANLVTGDDEGHVKLWTAGGKLVRECDGSLTRVIAAAWSPDGKHFAATTYGEQEPNTEREHTEAWIYKADGSTAAMITAESNTSGVCFSADSQRLAIHDVDREMRICDLHGTELEKIPVPIGTSSHPSGMAWAPQGEQVALGSAGVVTVMNLRDRSTHSTLAGAQLRVSAEPLSLAMPSPDLKKWLISWPNADSYEVWSAADGKREATLPDALERNTQASWSPAGDEIAYVEHANRLRVWHVGAPSSRVVFESENPLAIIAWSRDGKTLAALDQSGNLKAARMDGKILLQQKATAPLNVPRNGMRDRLSRMVFSADGKSIAVVEREAVQMIPLDGTAAKSIPVANSNAGGWGANVWLSQDGLWLTTMRKGGKTDGQIATTNLRSGARKLLDKFGDEFTSVDCSPDGKFAAIGFDTGFWQVRRLDDPAAAPLESLPAVHFSTIRSIAFSPDGRRFATGGWEGWIKIWSSEGKLQQTLYGHDWPVHVLTWSTDGQRLLSVGRDHTTLLWSLATGRPQLRFETARQGDLTLITEDGRIFGPATRHLDEEFCTLIEKPTGDMETVDYDDFLQRTGGH
jgi:WD40 repeat protein